MGKRIINNQQVAYTCENSRFATDISNPINVNYPGSVTPEPLYDDGGGQILLLENVFDKTNGNKCYWFMWYRNGNPMLNMSGVIDATDIVQVLKGISSIRF